MNIRLRSNFAYGWFTQFASETRFSALLLGVLAPLAMLQAQSNYVTPYTFTTFAGTKGLSGSADGIGPTVRFANVGGNIRVNGVALDSAGNVYVADYWNNTIRKIAPDGASTTIAGNAAQPPGFADGIGSQAQFNNPSGIAVDPAGNVYVADTNNNTIREISPAGVVTTLVQQGVLRNPEGVTLDHSGSILVADSGNCSIRKISKDGIVSTIAGGGTLSSWGTADGPGSLARFGAPIALAVDATGIIYVVDGDAIREISTNSVVTTLAGLPTISVYADGVGTAARFTGPSGIAVDSTGSVFVGDNTSIRKVTPGGEVTTVIGAGGHFPATVDGRGAAVRFSCIVGMAMDAVGTIYLMDSDTRTIVLRKGVPPNPLSPVITQHPTTAIVGAGDRALYQVMVADAPNSLSYQWQRAPSGSSSWSDLAEGGSYQGTTTAILSVTGTSIGMNGDLFRCVVGNGIGPAFASDAALLTVIPAGIPFFSDSKYQFSFYSNGYVDGSFLSYGLAICADSAGNIYFSDLGRSIIQKRTPAGTLTTLAGSLGISGYADGVGTAAVFNSPVGLAADQAGNIYVAEEVNRTIRKITPTGVVTTLAGSVGQNGTTDGGGGIARFVDPVAVAVDSAGNVYVADHAKSDTQPDTTVIRKISPDGTVTTFAGSYSYSDARIDSYLSSENRLNIAYGIAADNSGNLFAVDWLDDRVKKIAPDGSVTTIAGCGNYGSGQNPDGQGVLAEIGRPSAIAIDKANFLYVVAGGIRKISPTGFVTTIMDAQSGLPYVDPQELYGVTIDNSGTIFLIDNHQLASNENERITRGEPYWPPTITAQPSSLILYPTETAIFSVAATSPLPMTYQWLKNGVIIPGATGSSYSLANIAITDVGAYSVVISNARASATSSPAILSVSTSAPTFATQLANQTDAIGATVSFSAGVAGTIPFSYQWQKNGISLSNGGDISGATSATLTITNAQLADTGDYSVVVSSTYGTSTSNSGSLAVGTVGVVAVASGNDHNLFVRSDGTLWSMGDNTYGQLGDGTNIPRNAPVLIAGRTVAAFAEGNYSLFIKTDGSLWAMGDNSSGELGDGTNINRNTPMQVTTGVVSAAAGYRHCLFIKSDRTLWSMGINSYGQLGDGTTTNRSVPFQMATGVVAASAGFDHSLFIKSDGSLWAVGSNVSGQLGDGTNTNHYIPVQIATGIIAVSAGSDDFSMFVKSDSTLWAMGSNIYGQLGDGTTINRSTPEQVATDVVAVSAGGDHCVFIKSDNTLLTMGGNYCLQLGDGDVTGKNRTSPILVTSGVVTATAGAFNSLFIKSGGSLWGTGANGYGQLGDAMTYQRPDPILIAAGPLMLPSLPSRLIVTVGAPDPGMRLNWSPTIAATSYEIWRSTSNNSATATLIASNVPMALYYDRSAISGINYFYWIKAVNDAGASDFSNSGTVMLPPSNAIITITVQ